MGAGQHPAIVVALSGGPVFLAEWVFRGDPASCTVQLLMRRPMILLTVVVVAFLAAMALATYESFTATPHSKSQKSPLPCSAAEPQTVDCTTG